MTFEPQINQRVVLDPAQAESWTLPLRRFAQEGRVGVVKSILTHMTPLQYRVEFEVKRKGAKPQHQFLYARDLVEAPE